MKRKPTSRRLKKILVAGALLLILALGLFWKDLKLLPVVLTSFSAKEFCTCYFVNQQSEDYCRQLVRQYLPLGDLGFSADSKTVWAQGFGSRAEAFVESDARYGCRLQVHEVGLQ